jgi:hypothetical protein
MQVYYGVKGKPSLEIKVFNETVFNLKPIKSQQNASAEFHVSLVLSK